MTKNKPNNSDLRQRIEEILAGCIDDFVQEDERKKILDQILSAFIESLPEKKNIGELREFHARLGTSGEQEIIEALGYNQALTDIQTIMSKGADNCGICGDGGHTAFACPNPTNKKGSR